jgi:hypothetical protein
VGWGTTRWTTCWLCLHSRCGEVYVCIGRLVAVCGCVIVGGGNDQVDHLLALPALKVCVCCQTAPWVTLVLTLF